MKGCNHLLFYLLISIVLCYTPMISHATPQTSVTITISGGKILKAPTLNSNVDYLITIKVQDTEGKAIEGAHIELAIERGSSDIIGDTKGITDKEGIVKLRTKFTAGALTAVHINGKNAGYIWVYYSTPPVKGIAVVIFYFIALLSILGYTIYIGPVKWYLEEKSKPQK